jgi:hypothetical protein
MTASKIAHKKLQSRRELALDVKGGHLSEAAFESVETLRDLTKEFGSMQGTLEPEKANKAGAMLAEIGRLTEALRRYIVDGVDPDATGAGSAAFAAIDREALPKAQQKNRRLSMSTTGRAILQETPEGREYLNRLRFKR